MGMSTGAYLQISELRQAAEETWTALHQLSERAIHLYPIAGQYGRYSGFSYDIPKEEQIRSELYRALVRGTELAFELEWNLYRVDAARNVQTGMERVSRHGEVDLVGFGPRRIAALLEVKRVWTCLPDWKGSPKEMRASIEIDLKKLRDVRERAGNFFKGHVMSGVIVAVFSSAQEYFPKFIQGVLGEQYSVLKAPGSQPLCSYRTWRAELVAVFMGLYFVPALE